jgi:hypothetical protein
MVSIPSVFPQSFYSPAREIALRSLTEIVMSVALGAICCAFTATPTILWAGIAIQWMVNTAIRGVLAWTGKAPAHGLTAFIASVGSLHNLQILIHEVGHACSANCLLQDAGSTIKLFPYIGGSTHFKVIRPTPLGEMIGPHRLQPLIAAAGPVLTLALSTIHLALGLHLAKKAPELSGMLICASLINFLFHAGHALMAIGANPNQIANDFVVLNSAGLPPLVAAIAIIAVPNIIFWNQLISETALRSESQS